MLAWIWSTNETPRRGDGRRLVRVEPGKKKGTVRLYDPRNPDRLPDTISDATFERIREEEKP